MRSVLITGGAGFIGVNAALHFAGRGWRVRVLDNLSRRGAEANLEFLRERATVDFVRCDVRDANGLADAVGESRSDLVLHLSGQVAVTTSISRPREDFEINALGAFNLLEAVRQRSPASFIVNASTNKVYGRMEDVGIVEKDGRWAFRDLPGGVPESRSLDFHSPYGCSKGAADQYILDYGRSFGLGTVTLRQSCIYGPRQFGIEDQGWLAWFVIAAICGHPLTIYGDGKQVRDVLHVEDLVRVYEAAYEKRADVAGEAFNIGGGPENTLSLLELVRALEERLDRKVPLAWSEARVGDQPVFVCDVSKAADRLGWRPEVGWPDGVARLVEWVLANRSLF
jgi:CDP-paratose 2-epimerase